MLKLPKLTDLTKNQPTTPTNSRGRNLRTTVMFWNQAIWRTPTRFTMAGIQSPSRAMPQFSMPEPWMLNRAST